MKPVCLTMQAFGSYGRKTIIDFTKVQQNLFLICGDTGSGKSTIFDGMVYALYGQVSSNENRKEGAPLQSQYAEIDTEPYVTFVFEEDRKTYSVHRVPQHLHTLKRGKNAGSLALKNASVSLTLPDGKILEQKEAEEKIAEIVRLTKSQFMQVVMLAQGEFLSTLRASSTEKKQVFRKLFHTEVYAEVADLLNQRKTLLESTLESLRAASSAQAEHLQIQDNEELLSLQKEIQQGNLSSVPAISAPLEAYCKALKVRYDQLHVQTENARKQQEESVVRYEKAKTLSDYFEKQEQLQKEWETLQKELPQIEEKKKQAEAISEARRIYPLYVRKQEAETRLEETEKEVRSLEKEWPVLQEKVCKANAASEKESQTIESSLLEKTTQLEALRKALEALKEKQKADAELKDLKEDIQKSEEKLKKWDCLLEEKKQQLEKEKKTLETTGDVYTLLQEAERKEALFQKYEECLEEVEKRKERQKKQIEVFSSKKQTYREVSSFYQEAFETYVDNQAGFLAATLEEGKPCPVCGSLHHPSPAIFHSKERKVDRSLLESLQKSMQSAQKDYEASGAELKTIQSTLEERMQEAEELKKEVPFSREDVLREKQQALQLKKQHEEALEHWTRLQKEIDMISEKKQKESSLEQSLLQKQSAVSTRKEELEKQCLGASDKEILQQKSLLQKDIQTLREKRELLQKDRESLQLEENRVHTVLGKDREALPVLKQESQQRTQQFEDACSKVVLSENWKELALKEQEEKKLRKEVETYQGQELTLKTSLQQYASLIGNKEKPDLALYEKDRQDREQAFLTLQAQESTLSVQYSTNQKTYASLKKIEEESQGSIEKLERITRLYRWVNGSVTNGRMDLETYVQRYYLSQVLEYANVRFYAMTSGQFTLRLMPADKASIGKNRGLDLLVYSYATNQEREIKTLSGGESFMAALSLALGMADQIQQNVSSMHLDMLFIDEGFGSLDDTSRNEAVRVLKNLAGKDKMIGIISHVTELKTQVEDWLQVEKKEDGSHVSWKIS